MALLPAGCLFASHTLNPKQSGVIASWLSGHPGYRLATDRDCACDESIQRIRVGDGGDGKGVPDYHPYVAVGDFNGDGVVDLAVVVLNTRTRRDFTMLVFNGPVDLSHAVPAFVSRLRDLTGTGLFYGPPASVLNRLMIGSFESEGLVLQPHGKTYRLEE